MKQINQEAKQKWLEFVVERQNTFINKLNDWEYESPVLGKNKFTNCHRATDRMSVDALCRCIYVGSQKPLDVLKRIFCFIQFNTSTFLSWINFAKHDTQNIPEIIRRCKVNDPKIKMFTSAYVVPGKSGESKAYTIADRCQILESKSAELQKAIDEQNMLSIYNILLTIPGVGGFLASQTCFDFYWHNSTNGWEPLYKLGVGAMRGAYKLGLIEKWDRVSDDESKYALRTLQDWIASIDYPFVFANNQKVELRPEDLQNLLCEGDKWLRLKMPEIKCGKASPTTIKNKYIPRPKIDYYVPGHWVGSSSNLELVSAK